MNVSTWPPASNIFAQSCCRDRFLARFRDILAFFCKKSHQNSQSEKKLHTEFLSFHAVKFLFCTCGSFQDYRTVLFCMTCFWIIVAPKFITHMTAGNHSLICIIEKLYRKISLSVSGLSKRFFDQQKNVRRLGKKIKKIICPEAV